MLLLNRDIWRLKKTRQNPKNLTVCQKQTTEKGLNLSKSINFYAPKSTQISVDHQKLGT